jgi:hypothetical protein
MEYAIGSALALAVGGVASAVGFDRDRAFYPTVLIVIASYYILFAAMGASIRTLIAESAIASAFSVLAVVAFKRNLWLVAAATAGHGLFDLVHHWLIQNPGVPVWWPGFCMAFDVMFGAFIAIRLLRPPRVG